MVERARDFPTIRGRVIQLGIGERKRAVVKVVQFATAGDEDFPAFKKHCKMVYASGEEQALSRRIPAIVLSVEALCTPGKRISIKVLAY